MYISHMVPHALHDGDPLSLFRINEFSARARDDFQRGGFLENLVDKHLLTNKHYLQLKYTPDSTKAATEEQQEKRKLSTLDAALSQSEKNVILEECKALKNH